MHNEYVRPNGQWPPELVLMPVDLRRFDVAQFQALNVTGGTWNPQAPLAFGGSGVFFTGAGGVGHLLSGGVETLSGGRVVLGASIYPSFATTQSRTIRFPFTQTESGAPGIRIGAAALGYGTGAQWVPVWPRYLHNGATIASANVEVQIGQQHAAVPAALPQALFVRIDWAPWTPLPWAATHAYAAGSIVIPTTANGSVYVASGAGGTSGGSEPNWSTAAAVNQSLTDGTGGTTITWVNTGYSSNAPSWAPATVYAVGALAQPSPANGLVYVVIAAAGSGTSGATQPAFPLTPGATIVDNPGFNQITWACIGTPRAAKWTASTTYKQGAIVSAPSNGFYYYNSTAGSNASGSTQPAWGTTVGGNTVDNAVTWVCIGTNPIGAGSLATPASAAAYFDGGATQLMSVPCSGATIIDTADYSYAMLLLDESGLGAFQSSRTPSWIGNSTLYVAGAMVNSVVQAVPANGFAYECIYAGNSATAPPVWPIAIGSTVAESGGAPIWECLGPVGLSENLFLSAAFSFTSIVDMRPE